MTNHPFSLDRSKARTFRGAGALAQGISPSMLAPLSGMSLSDIQSNMGPVRKYLKYIFLKRVGRDSLWRYVFYICDTLARILLFDPPWLSPGMALWLRGA